MGARLINNPRQTNRGHVEAYPVVCTENPTRIDDVTESRKLAG